jgi:hypothetical protein
MQPGKQQGHNMAIARRSCGAALKFHLFRILRVVRALFARITRANSKGFHSFRAKFRVRQQAKIFRCKQALHHPRRARTNARKTAIKLENPGWPRSCVVKIARNPKTLHGGSKQC